MLTKRACSVSCQFSHSCLTLIRTYNFLMIIDFSCLIFYSDRYFLLMEKKWDCGKHSFAKGSLCIANITPCKSTFNLTSMRGLRTSKDFNPILVEFIGTFSHNICYIQAHIDHHSEKWAEVNALQLAYSK